jgi:hypothetical protein
MTPPEDQFGPPGEAYREIIREQRMLIAELVAAIVDLQHPYAEHAYDELLQRAREATQ